MEITEILQSIHMTCIAARSIKAKLLSLQGVILFKLNSGKNETQTPKVLQLQTTGSVYQTVAVI